LTTRPIAVVGVDVIPDREIWFFQPDFYPEGRWRKHARSLGRCAAALTPAPTEPRPEGSGAPM
ncbi:MAG TPA: hypothetical protein VGQ81_16070, partial [Acidobacteriota bacterium]|nr:hypothetical protein [Acidobacteriota bacterium]